MLTGAAGSGECLMDGDMRAFWFQHSAFADQDILVTSSNATEAETEADQDELRVLRLDEHLRRDASPKGRPIASAGPSSYVTKVVAPTTT